MAKVEIIICDNCGKQIPKGLQEHIHLEIGRSFDGHKNDPDYIDKDLCQTCTSLLNRKIECAARINTYDATTIMKKDQLYLSAIMLMDQGFKF